MRRWSEVMFKLETPWGDEEDDEVPYTDEGEDDGVAEEDDDADDEEPLRA